MGSKGLVGMHGSSRGGGGGAGGLDPIGEALSGDLGNRGKRVFISGEQGNKGQILRGTGKQRQYWGTGNIRKQIFDFGGTGE